MQQILCLLSVNISCFLLQLELNLIKSIGMLKHNVSSEEVAQILSFLIFQRVYYATFDEENFEHYIVFTNWAEFFHSTWSELKN